jgi:hypothetical protein
MIRTLNKYSEHIKEYNIVKYRNEGVSYELIINIMYLDKLLNEIVNY